MVGGSGVGGCGLVLVYLQKGNGLTLLLRLMVVCVCVSGGVALLSGEEVDQKMIIWADLVNQLKIQLHLKKNYCVKFWL